MSLSAERSASSARNLGNLFGSSRSGSNDGTTRSLAYTAPKEPSKEVARAKEKAPAGNEKEAEAPKASGVQYAYVGRTRLYKLESGAYVALSAEQLGCVILGAGSTYQLLIYDSSKRHLLTALVTEVVPAMPQENGYVTFSARAATWSAHFDSGAYDFCRALALTHAHCVAHKGDPSVSPLPFYVLAPEVSGGRKAEAGDKASLSRRKWVLDDSPTAVPTAIVTKAAPEPDMNVVIIAGDGALGNALLGATVGTKRGYVEFDKGHSSWIETEVVDVAEVPREEPSLGDNPPAIVEDRSSEDRRSSITERMAGLAAASGVVGVAPLIAPVRRESKATAAVEPSKEAEPVKTEPPSDAADRLKVSEPVKAPEQSQPVQAAAVALTTSNTPRSTAVPERTENAVALVPGQEARSHFFVGGARHEQEPHEDKTQSMLAMQSSMAMQQMQSALLAVQSSMSQAHHKLDRLMDGWTRNGAADGDLDALASRVSAVLREHARLRATASDRDAKRGELEDKLELLREKNAQLVADKLAVLEKHAQLVSKGADETLRTRTLEEAAKERDELQGKLRETQAGKAALEQQLADERAEKAALLERLNNAEAAARAASSQEEVEAAVAARTAELGKAAEVEKARLEGELEKVTSQADFLEERCQDAEKKAHRLSQDLEAATKQRDDALIRERDALARAEHLAKEGKNESAKEEPPHRTELIKTIMNDTYKHLFAYFTAAGPEASFSAADAARAIKATLKQVTSKYLTTHDQPRST